MRWRRSPREIAFRLNQELQNLVMLATRPGLPEAVKIRPLPLPEPGAVAAKLSGTRTATTITRFAEDILGHRFPLLGLEIDTGPEIHWRRDYLSGIETEPAYFRRIPYLFAGRAGD